MNMSPALRTNFIPLSSCSSCYHLRFHLVPVTSASFVRRARCGLRDLLAQVTVLRSEKRKFVCRLSETEADSENNDKDKHELDDKEEQTSVDSVVESSGAHDSQPTVVDQGKDRSLKSSILSLENMLGNHKAETTVEDKIEDEDRSIKSSILSLQNMLNRNEAKTAVEDSNEAKPTVIDSNEDFDNKEVTSGSPLPGVKLGDFERIPKETIDILKSEVFGFDTFFVTSQEPYEVGVLFKGNLRGTAASSYEKIAQRLKDKFGDQYKLFLLNNPEDDKPVAVIVPRQILQPETTAVPEWFAAASFAAVTLFTLLLRNVPDLQSNLLSTFDNLNLLKDGLPGALVTAVILGAHEISHILVAKSCGVKLGVPYYVPSWQIGSFGTITRIVNIVSKREDLLKVAVAGPLAGFSLGLVLLLVGFIVPPSDGLGVVVNSSVFHESFLAGGIAKLLLGDALKEGAPIAINPLVIWAWAGLVINAINCIPAGELDGGRISFAIWGRKASARFTGASIVLLGLSSLINDIAFYWVVLIFFLQRGPIAPLSEEITEPDNKYVALGVAVLFLGLLVCLPYPFLFSTEALPISSM